MEEVKNAILRTLVYSDIFDYPLTLAEIHKFLAHDREVPLKKLEQVLKVLEKGDSRVGRLEDYYFLSQRKNLVSTRRQRLEISRKKFRRAKKLSHLLRIIPWIKMVAVTGTLAVQNADDDDDIDLLIVTTPQRVWLTRGLVVTVLRLFGLYRRPGKVKDRFCPNIFLSTKALRIPRSERSLYLAREVVQIKPLWDRFSTYNTFMLANDWVVEFLGNHELPQLSPRRFTRGTRLIYKLLIGPRRLLNHLEELAMSAQLKYMASKKTTETTTPDTLRFHPEDVHGKVLDVYRQRLKKLGIS